MKALKVLLFIQIGAMFINRIIVNYGLNHWSFDLVEFGVMLNFALILSTFITAIFGLTYEGQECEIKS